MGANNIIIREYLENLKEDKELDHLFPILLNVMGFRIVTTAKESKGQPQYGKDIIAIGVDEDQIRKRFYFELKGHSDKDIDDTVLNKKDGITDSLKASRYTEYQDSSIPGFNQLPIKYILVHNGILKSNTRRTFNGFIKDLFPEGNFDRWDIYKLTDLFNEYLFGEYLFTDEKSLKLFKKSLVLLDAPHNDYNDFKSLVDLQIEKIDKIKKGRAFNKFFATQNLLASIIVHYSDSNLEPAKHCLTYLLLKTWAWILENKLEKRRVVKDKFSKLIDIHYQMLNMFFEKTLEVAKSKNGLFQERGSLFEEIGYPLRSFEYLNYLIYFFEARLYFLKSDESKLSLIRREQKDILIELIENNVGCQRPILDNHSIAILNVILFFLNEDAEAKDLEFVANYIFNIIENILIIKNVRNRFPSFMDEISFVKNVVKNRRFLKQKQPSLLVSILFELIAILEFDFAYKQFLVPFRNKLDLQTAHPYFNHFDIEQLLFERTLHDEFYVESIELKDTLNEFKKDIKERKFETIEYRTDKEGFSFLRKLAHIYFKNDYFVDEWRKHL